jgi:hypothetical protein
MSPADYRNKLAVGHGVPITPAEKEDPPGHRGWFVKLVRVTALPLSDALREAVVGWMLSWPTRDCMSSRGFLVNGGCTAWTP